MRILVYGCLLVAVVAARKHHHRDDSSSSDDDESTAKSVLEKEGEKLVDRLTVNMAGAFVKSMFPEMDRKPSTLPGAEPGTLPQPSSEIRRAPAQMQGLDAPLTGYSPQQVAQQYNAIPQTGNGASDNPFAYQQQGSAPSSFMSGGGSPLMSPMGGGGGSPMGGSSMGGGPSSSFQVPSLPETLTAGSGGVNSLNAVRNQQYLAQLAKHQQDLASYSAKQMAYLDNQRRYQQAMLDHQAGAALLMQQEQQNALKKQMDEIRRQEAASSENFQNDNTVGGRVLTARARGVKNTGPGYPKRKYNDDDVLTNDEHMMEYFKKQYGIDIAKDGSKLTADEKAILRQLKKQLASQKDKAVKNGAFATMNKLKNSVKSAAKKQAVVESDSACSQCIPFDIDSMKGAWTQMYGNPSATRKTYSTLMSLEKLEVKGGRRTTNLSHKKVGCVGLEIGAMKKGASELNLFYRENDEGNQLHEMKGTMSMEDNDAVAFDTDLYHTKMCLVKAGPSDADRYEYVVLAETQGTNSCRNYLVFARNTDEFNRRHFDDVSEFMNNEVSDNNILPVGAFPKASLCQLDRP